MLSCKLVHGGRETEEIKAKTHSHESDFTAAAEQRESAETNRILFFSSLLSLDVGEMFRNVGLIHLVFVGRAQLKK